MAINEKTDISRKNLEAYLSYAETMLQKYTVLVRDLKIELDKLAGDDRPWIRLMNDKTRIFQKNIVDVKHTNELIDPNTSACTYIEHTEILFTNDEKIAIDVIGSKRVVLASIKSEYFSNVVVTINDIPLDNGNKFAPLLTENLSKILTELGFDKTHYRAFIELIETFFDFYSHFECDRLRLYKTY